MLPSSKSLKIILLAILTLSMPGCRDTIQDELAATNSASAEQEVPWIDQIKDLDFGSIVFVQNGESIQRAIEVASPGDVIYVEPGDYDEHISINKSDIHIIGLNGMSGQKALLKNAGIIGRDITVNASGVAISNLFNTRLEPIKYEGASEDAARIGKKKCVLLNTNRTDLGTGIAHYQFDLSVGEGEFDVVKIHRVVMEKKPYRPIATKGDIFMVHGAIQDFDDIFLTAGAEIINENTSAPYYLALNKIDVWGIDLGWTRVPLETEDFGFMQGWGVDKDVTHTLKGMAVARLIRGLTGQSFCRMNLLGFSYGVQIAYGAADRETQEHWMLRNVKGIIPVDSQLKIEDEEIALTKCANAENWMSQIEAGQYNRPWGVGIIAISELALTNPEGHDLNETLTNSQYMEAVFQQGFFGGDQGTMFYTDPVRAFRLGVSLAPHMPMLMFYEMNACQCPTLEVAYDGHLAEITIPIYYIGAGGGAAESGNYTSTLTASQDISYNVVSLTDNPATDFGHADLWMGRDASSLVWNPLQEWLVNHNSPSNKH